MKYSLLIPLLFFLCTSCGLLNNSTEKYLSSDSFDVEYFAKRYNYEFVSKTIIESIGTNDLSHLYIFKSDKNNNEYLLVLARSNDLLDEDVTILKQPDATLKVVDSIEFDCNYSTIPVYGWLKNKESYNNSVVAVELVDEQTKEMPISSKNFAEAWKITHLGFEKIETNGLQREGQSFFYL